MAQVRAIRRPFISRRGRVNDAHRAQESQSEVQQEVPQPESPSSTIVTIELPPLPELEAASLPEASNEEREASGIGEPAEGVEAVPDGTEYELTAESSDVDAPEPAAQQEQIDYRQWTVPQLTAELKRRELPSSGSKAEQVERLVEWDARQGG